MGSEREMLVRRAIRFTVKRGDLVEAEYRDPLSEFAVGKAEGSGCGACDDTQECDDSYWVAECVDLPVVTQAASLEELVNNIREAVEVHLEGEDLESLGLPPRPRIHATIELKLPGKSD